MERVGIDIQNHQTTGVSQIEVDAFQFIVALDKQAKRDLIQRYGVSEAKVIDLFVKDPFGYGPAPYIKCREEISKKLAALRLVALD